MRSNKTKAFSYDIRDEIWFSKLAAEARRERRSQSGQLIYMIKLYFENKRLMAQIRRKEDGPG